MAGLQVLEETFSASGFHVLGFYSNDFGMQGGDDGQMDACTDQYMLTFEQFKSGHVIGDMKQPVWEWLLSQPNPDMSVALEPTWNFHKYLISKDGQLVQHFVREVYPGDDPNDPNDSFETNPVVVAIQAELAK
jgi:glutathione peroxidase